MSGLGGFRGILAHSTGKTILPLLLAGAGLISGGCTGLVQGNPSGGGTPLSISNLGATSATSTSVVLGWQTSAPANSQVEYGTTTSYGSTTALDSTMATSHQETVTNLKPGTLYHFRVHSTDASGAAAVSGDLTSTTAVDTTPPTVSITSPAANSTLSATILVTATAADNVAVASVQFKVDNANSGAAITTAPYSYSLNTTTLSDGNHILSAVATDTSGNSTASAGVAVKVNNATPGPSIAGLNPLSGGVGTSVTISGANFGTTQGTSTVSFNGVAATPTSWSATSIVAPVPAGATTGNVVVTVGGMASNGVSFTVTVPGPSITGLNPTSGLVGTAVTISGANFGATQGTSTVKFNGVAATPTSWSATSIVAPVPAGATTGNVVVTVGGVASNGVSFTVTVAGPSVTSLNPTSGGVGTSVTISGANFGATQGTSTVKFNGTTATPTSWSATSIIAPVPAGATTGNVVVTVGGVASNGASFTVQSDTTAPVVTITAPANNATVSGTITLTATATDPDSPVSFVQFRVDGANVGAQLTTAPYSLSFDTTTLANGSYTLTAVGQDPSGNVGASVAVTINVSNTINTSMGPLVQSSNTNYFKTPAGKTIVLVGTHTWNSAQDTDTSTAGTTSLQTLDYNAYIANLVAWGHNTTILWHKDLPHYCGWIGGGGGNWTMGPWQWARTGPGNATDGGLKFDLSTFNQAFFDRMRARALLAQQNGIYVIVQLFDGLGLASNRCGNDGYPLTGANNINGVDDGGGINSITMSAPNAITAVQEAYVKKMVDTLNDLQNVIWEPSEEAPNGVATFWQPFMIDLLHKYEGGGTLSQTGEVFTAKTFQHPVLYASLQSANDPVLVNSNADAVAPGANVSPTSSCGSGTPVCKVNINDSDHSYFGIWNDTQANQRHYIWHNITNGNGLVFMDPYVIFNSGGNRNSCASPTLGVCPAPITTAGSYQMNIRLNMGYAGQFLNGKMNLTRTTPQPSLCSTGQCLATNTATRFEFLVYSPSTSTFTVDLSVQNGQTMHVQWLDPVTGTITNAADYTATSSTVQTFTPPGTLTTDAVLYLVDVNGGPL